MATLKKILSPAKDKEEKSSQNSSDALRLIMNDKAMREDIYNGIQTSNKIISTGSMILDSVVKIRSGQVIRLVGKGQELGKTSESLVIAENYMKTMPNAKTIFIAAEGRCSKELRERSGMKFVFSPEEWEYGTVFVLWCNIFETVAKTILNTVKAAHDSGEHICIILDSLDGLILKADLEKGFDGNAKVAGVPLLTKLLFKHLALPICHYDALFLVTGQYAAEIKIDPYAPNIPRQASSSGGSSIAHQSDYVFEFQPRYGGDAILENENERPDRVKNKTIGLYCKVTFRKSASDVSGETVTYPIKKKVIGPAIWVEKEVADLIVAFEMAKKPSGSWFTFSPDILEEAKQKELEVPEKVQGMNGIYKLLEDSKIYEFFAAKIKEMISDE